MKSKGVKLRRCPCCGLYRNVSDFKKGNWISTVCHTCQAEPEVMEERRSSLAEAAATTRLEKNLREAYAATGIPGKRKQTPWEKNYWNLATDPWPDLFRGKGLSAEYCPVV